MTWNAFHNRGEILRQVIAVADERLDGDLPLEVPGVRDNFTGELDLLSALMLKWHARLSGNLERELMLEPLDLEAAVARAWRVASDEMPGVRAIIDRYNAQPVDRDMATALERARDREWLRLAGAAGVASDESGAAARAGARIESAARALEPGTIHPVDLVPEQRTTPGSFVERLKAVLAA